MKTVIMLMGMICMATSAMAFGGGGGGHDSTKYNRHNPGVDNFGVHIHPDNPPLDIRFYDIKDDANAQPCQAGANVYCCKAGYVVDVATSKCVACPSGSVATLEENFKCTVCTEEEGISLDKTACCDPADATCMNPNKECHPDYLGNCGSGVCSDMGGQWCGNKNQCVSKNEECCPNGGSLGTDGQTCCLGGYVYKGVEECSNLNLPDPAQEMARKGYCTLNIPLCGCDDIIAKTELSSSGKGCCFGGYYDEGYWGYWSFDWNNIAECNGCGYGQLVEKEEQKYCCDGPYDISSCSYSGANGWPNCTSPASTGAAITQVCCEATSGMKWCASNNTCVDEQASCPCVGEGGPCQKCEDGAWVADEECLCEADDNVWDASKQECCPYGFWLEYKNIEEDGAACCDQHYNWYNYYTNQPTEDCCHAMTDYGVWDEDNQLCCSVDVDNGTFGYDAYQYKPTEACCNFVEGGWDADMQNCCPRDAWVEDAQACCWGPKSYFTNEITEGCCKGVSGKWDNTGKTCCETAEGAYFGVDALNGQKTEACCNLVGGNWSNGDCTPKTSQ